MLRKNIHLTLQRLLTRRLTLRGICLDSQVHQVRQRLLLDTLIVKDKWSPLCLLGDTLSARVIYLLTFTSDLLYFLHQGDDGNRKHLWNVDEFLWGYTAQQPWKKSSSAWFLLAWSSCNKKALSLLTCTHWLRYCPYFSPSIFRAVVVHDSTANNLKHYRVYPVSERLWYLHFVDTSISSLVTV